MSDDARADVLARIRAALGPDPEIPEIPRRYVAAGARAPTGDQALVDRFAQRVADYRADVHRCDEAELPRLLGRLLAGERTVATPDLAAALPRSLDPLGDDPALHHTALDRLDAVLTGCATAIAETGTIVLDGGRDSGRRAISLIPDHHGCGVGADQVVADVPDAIAVLGP
ncbi:MAG: LutC/YkgG family protein, partial [Solirubrobacteraceae bacterium]